MEKKKIFCIISFLVCCLFCFSENKFVGVCYGPFRDNENPDCGVLPTEKEIEEDIQFLSKLTNSLRSYGSTGSLKSIPKFCADYKIDCYPGGWLSKYKRENEKEINALIEIGKQKNPYVKGLIVGNEVLLRGDLKEEELIYYIKKVKNETGLPVTTAEIWSVLMKHPNIVKEIDFILVHIHPYWERKSIEEAGRYVIEKWKEIKNIYPEKEVIIGETGWPSKGEVMGKAVPSEENQFKFLSQFLRYAKENNVKYFLFEAFDEKWKLKFEGGAGANWGIYYSNGYLKPLLKNLVPSEAQQGIQRPARKLSVISVSVPFSVWVEVDSQDNHFYPTGWMGDINSIFLDDECTENPHSGKTCIKIKYQPKITDTYRWAGIYFQFPINNWGDYPGYNIKGAKKLTFWARGEKGGEMAEFKVGGINRHPHKDSTKPYEDSFGPVTTRPSKIKLTKEWKKYEIDLTGENLSNVIGGFCWVTNVIQNPKGCTIYLDDINFE
ncbi:MAG: glycosyl hydrolase family 17 protein [bacterium]|nr:glycosyl hydrolase family 17 protein [bacterium]MDW8164301.1 glycosyl hydrolase family 17 protein [Candidatus Omnitrophota bacterium]